MNLILPVDSRSTRFSWVKPKWLITHSNRNLMIAEAIKSLDLKSFNNIYIVCIKVHYDEYSLHNPLISQFEKMISSISCKCYIR